jgi:hypothetical protein
MIGFGYIVQHDTCYLRNFMCSNFQDDMLAENSDDDDDDVEDKHGGGSQSSTDPLN